MCEAIKGAIYILVWQVPSVRSSVNSASINVKTKRLVPLNLYWLSLFYIWKLITVMRIQTYTSLNSFLNSLTVLLAALYFKPNLGAEEDENTGHAGKIQVLSYEWGGTIRNQVTLEGKWDAVLIMGDKWQNLRLRPTLWLNS